MTGRIDLCAASYGLACGPRPVCLGARQLVLNAVKHGSTICTTGCSSGFALCLRRRRAGQSVARWRAEKPGCHLEQRRRVALPAGRRVSGVIHGEQLELLGDRRDHQRKVWTRDRSGAANAPEGRALEEQERPSVESRRSSTTSPPSPGHGSRSLRHPRAAMTVPVLIDILLSILSHDGEPQ